jgi:hypothetical protein
VPQKSRGFRAIGQMGVGENADTEHTNQGAGNLPARTFLAPLPDRVNRHCGLDGSSITCMFSHAGQSLRMAVSADPLLGKTTFPLDSDCSTGISILFIQAKFFYSKQNHAN